MSWYSIKLSSFLAILTLAILPATTVAQDNLSAKRPFGQHTQTFAASETFDAGVTENWKLTLTGNVTASTLIGAEAGMFLKWEICQDATGSRTFVWPSQLQNPLAIIATANACTTEIFYYDGTNGLVPVTTTSGGGGSGTVSAGTVNQIAKYTASTTVSSDANLDDGLTTANTLTYLGSNGIAATQYSSSGTGAMTYIGTEGTCSGAAAGKDVLCLGDLTSHAAQISNNGDSFRPAATHQSTSPTAHGIMLAETFPQIFAAPRGTQGQAFLEGAGAGDPGFGQLDLSLATNVVNRLVKANQTASTVYNDQVNVFTAAGTLDLSGSTVASALRVPNGAGITVSLEGALAIDTTNHNLHAGVNAADSRVPIWTGTAPVHHNCAWWTNVSGHIELGDSTTTCGGGSTPRLDQVTSATNPWTTTNGDNPLSVQFAATTAGRKSFEITESSAATSTGTPYLLYVHTLAASTHNPCFFTARGTANGVQCDAVTGSLSPIGTANINATQVNGAAFPTSASLVGSNGSAQAIAVTAIPNGVTATTQSAGDTTNDLATDSFVSTAVSNAIAASNPAIAVLAASTANLTGTYSNGASGIGATFTITATGTFVLDGITINTIGQRVLLKDQSTGFQNGMYTATVVGTTGVSAVFTRALDYDAPSDINTTGAIPVQSGTVNLDTSWLLTSTISTVGTDALTFIQFTIAPTQLVTAASNAAAVNQVWTSGGANKTAVAVDFPETHTLLAAVCINGTAAPGWSTTATTPTATCRAGTNDKDAYLLWGASDVAYAKLHLPTHWDSGTNPSISLDMASTDATNGHTIIMQVATACAKGDGSTTDDVAFNTAQSFGTITLNGNANRSWTATLSNITMTGCAAPGILFLKFSRTTDTSTSVQIYEAEITIPIRPVVQAN